MDSDQQHIDLGQTFMCLILRTIVSRDIAELLTPYVLSVRIRTRMNAQHQEKRMGATREVQGSRQLSSSH